MEMQVLPSQIPNEDEDSLELAIYPSQSIMYRLIEGARKQQYNILATIAYCLAIYIHQSQFVECPYQTDVKCIKLFLLPRLPMTIIQIVIVALIFTTLIYLSIKGRIHWVFNPLLLGTLICVLLIVPHTLSTTDYSLLYQFILFVGVFIFSLIFCVYQLCSRCYLKYGIICVLAVLMMLLGTGIYTYTIINNSCQNWKNGIGGHQLLQDNHQYCTVIEPTICWYDILDGVFDATRIYNCSNRIYNQEEANKQLISLQSHINIPNGTAYIELPRTEYFNDELHYLPQLRFQKMVLLELSYHQTLDSISELAESYLDIQQMKYITKITPNASLIEQRSKQFKQTQSRITDRKMPKNIITIWVDAVSRARFMQKLSKSVGWFEQNSHQQTHQVFQAFRYLALEEFTTPNYFAYEYGEDFNAKELKNHSHWSMIGGKQDTGDSKITSNTATIRDAGYIIGKARSQCGPSIADLGPKYANIYDSQPTDHEFAAVTCDPNFLNPDNPFGPLKGPYSILKKCLYERQIHDYIFDYGRDFLLTYKDQPKYLELYLLDGHEGTGENIKYLDEPLRQFMDWLEQNDMHKDSIIILQSDHGLHMNGLFYLLNLDIFKLEKQLPGMFMLVDNNLFKDDQQQQQLIENQQKVLSLFEMHYLLKYLVTNDELALQNSLLSNIIPLGRSCWDLPNSDQHKCACE